MSSYSRIVTLDGRSANSVKAWLRLIAGFQPAAIQRVSSMFGDISGGVHSGRLTIATTAVAASGTVTFSSLANNDTVTINGRVYTAKTSGATGLQQFNLGASDTAAATNFAAAVNADTNAAILGVVSASSVATITTITALVPGNIGNLVTLAISAHGSVSGANATGGSEDANVVMYNGI